ncbi:hypothetical protein PLICRDRAFT_647502 [Plicaturopsis crispa FD-325 SS-3]|nr:hypothetical protein PLICRDRAFT_647502 [Plicaturopsis crispa FD-325 SS-3]
MTNEGGKICRPQRTSVKPICSRRSLRGMQSRDFLDDHSHPIVLSERLRLRGPRRSHATAVLLSCRERSGERQTKQGKNQRYGKPRALFHKRPYKIYANTRTELCMYLATGCSFMPKGIWCCVEAVQCKQVSAEFYRWRGRIRVAERQIGGYKYSLASFRVLASYHHLVPLSLPAIVPVLFCKCCIAFMSF